jgi:hypothetical protein
MAAVHRHITGRGFGVSALAGRDRRRRGQSAKRLKWVEAEHEATRAHNGRRLGVVLLSWAGLGWAVFGSARLQLCNAPMILTSFN